MTSDDLKQGNWPIHFTSEEAERDRYWWAPYLAQAITWTLAFGAIYLFWRFLIGPQ